ncbi:calcium-binding protein [Rhizobium sp. LjRoot254]|uniref:calcium-binding protein n=1 Tax=Rhizobium sp. LjRoot254 TaxID=3342297 RepID=UPI003ECF993B
MKMTGSTYNDTLRGGKAKDLIWGNAGNDLISGWEEIGDGAADVIHAGGGNDLISGFSFNFSNPNRSKSRGASIDGDGGDDTLIVDAEGGAKTTELSRMGLVAKVSGVEEIIYNFSEATLQQTLMGTKAGETIYGGENGAKIRGENGNDYLFAGRGDDVLNGGGGNDFLSAAGGRNQLTGGAGADVFQFHLTEDYSYSNITDFQKGIDKIALVLDIGGEFDPAKFGDQIRIIDREMDEMGYLNYDNGRIMDRGLFSGNAGFFADEMIYEESTGSFLQVFRDGDDTEYQVLLAHVESEGGGKPNLDVNDFVFMVL